MWRYKWIWIGIVVTVLLITAVLAGVSGNGGDVEKMSATELAVNMTEQSGKPNETPVNNSKNTITIKVNLSKLSRNMENKFSDINQWDLSMDWLSEKAAEQPEDYIRKNYPFVKRVQLMAATGGSQSRDLFLNPMDREKLNDYNFSSLGTAVNNVLRQGLTPYIVIGNVPLKYSSDPYIGGFGVNVRPPDDYNIYFQYIKALAEYMVDRFGLEQVRTWTWRALVEYENIDWFDAGNPQSTKEAYFKLYDYTVAALEEVIGAEHVYIGAHSMTNDQGYWDEREFIDHVAFGTNYYTGKKGTQIDFLTFSYYDVKPGLRSPSLFTVASNLNLLRERAEKNGLTNLEYGVDEGRIASGPDNKELFPRSVASSYQSAYDAKLYKQMHDINLDYFSTWYLNTERVWGGAIGIDPVGTHLANLTYRMAGASRVSLQASEPVSIASNEVDGVAAYHQNSQTAQLLIYNFNENPESKHNEFVNITFDNVEALKNGTVRVKKWIIDDEHANYWPKWQAYLEQHSVFEGDFGGWSSHSWTVTSIASHKVQQYWYTNLEEYRELSRLKSEETTMEIKDNKLVLSQDLASQGVVFYEITGIKPNP